MSPSGPQSPSSQLASLSSTVGESSSATSQVVTAWEGKGSAAAHCQVGSGVLRNNGMWMIILQTAVCTVTELYSRGDT